MPPERTFPDPLPAKFRQELRTGTDTTELAPDEAHGFPPPAGDVAGLRAQIFPLRQEGNDPKFAVRGVEDLYRDRRVGRDTRVATLLFLADVPQLRYGGQSVDRSGRPGIVVYFDGGGVRDTLLLDATTGAVLAYEMTLLVDPGALPDLRYPAVISYTTYLEARQVDRVPD
jgi:hypothetical protein